MTEEQKQQILKEVIWEHEPTRPKGGQHVGFDRGRFTLSHPDFDFKIISGEFRTQGKNREFMMVLFELFLEELGKG